MQEINQVMLDETEFKYLEGFWQNLAFSICHV